MKTLQLLLLAILLPALLPAASLKQISAETGISLKTLKEAKRAGVKLNWDDLKDRLEISASDDNLIMANLSGTEERSIELSWTTGTESCEVTVYYTKIYGDPVFPQTAELYAEKKKILDLNDIADSRIGPWNSGVNEHQKIAYVSEIVTRETAIKIASTSPNALNIRFYSSSGYVDAKPSQRAAKRFGFFVRLIREARP